MRPALDIDWDAQPLGREYDPAIAKRLGCSKALVQLHRSTREIPPCRTPITPTEVREIRRLRREGMTYREIAEEIGCSHGMAHKICTGQVRRDVE